MGFQIVRLKLRNAVVPPKHSLFETVGWGALIRGLVVFKVRVC